MNLERFKNHYHELEALQSEAGSLVRQKDETLGWIGQLKEQGAKVDEGVLPILGKSAEQVEPDEKESVRAQLASSLMVAALTVGQVQQVFQTLSRQATGILQRALNWLLNHLFMVVNAVANHLNIDSWTVEASGGFPWGVNVAISVTFK